MNQKNFENLQTIIATFFIGVDDKIVSDFVDVFNYRVKATYPETNKLLDKFLDEYSIRQSFVNVLIDSDKSEELLVQVADSFNKKSEYFFRSSLSDRDMINNISSSLFNVVVQRFRKKIYDNPIIPVKSKDNKNFEFIKTELLNTYDRLNECEQYMYSESDDAKLVKKIKGLKNE